MMIYTAKDETTMTEVIPALNHLSGKAAAFVRGFLTHLADSPGYESTLRKAQDAGVRYVEELGETISIPYVSKLTKQLESSGVVDKVRKGRHYKVAGHMDNPTFITMLRVLETEWGTTIEAEDSPVTIAVRSLFLDHMSDNGAVRISKDNPLPKAAYQVAIDKFKSGQYDMVFIESDRTPYAADKKTNMRRVYAFDASAANR